MSDRKPPLEILSGRVEPVGSAFCEMCDAPAVLYAVGTDEQQHFSCLEHHGLIVGRLLMPAGPVATD